MSEPAFWEDRERAVRLSQRAEQLRADIQKWESLRNEISELRELADLTSESDANAWKEIQDQTAALHEKVKEARLIVHLSGPYDRLGAILTLHAGAGGVDAQDWTQMLFRMYSRYAEKKGWKVSIIDETKGGEAGLKKATLLIEGLQAYGFLKSEAGVHRLVRISPFDAEALRHTSFALCEVIPDLPDDVNLEINEDDLQIDTYRSSGHGGQSVNTTDSAVRITHTPTGIVVTCQNERSQRQNREFAMKMLRAKLAHQREQDRIAQERALKGEHQSAAWGNQIRSYVLHPYKLVKDHRTSVESNDPEAVLEGDLDLFVTAYLHTLGA